MQEAYEVKVSEMEGMVFHPVVRGPPQPRLEVLHANNHAMRIVSPSQCSSSSNSSSSPIDSLSGDDSPDSASGSAPTASSSSTVRRVVRKHRKSSKDAKKRESGKSPVAAVGEQALPGSSASSTLPKPSPKPSAQDTFADSSSEEDATPAHLSPPRSRRQRKLPPGKSPGEEENHLKKYLESGTSSEPQEPKIVGILKKSQGSSAASTIHSTDSEGRETRRWNGTENGLLGSVLTSRASSANSVLALEQRHGEREGYGLINGSRVSRDTITMSSAGTIKRVRFSDNLESSSTYSTPAAQQPSTVSIKSSMELWKRVVPNSLCGRHSPNTIFSPRMKISLSQRGPMQKPPLPSDRITVHVPRGYEYLTQQPNGVKQESKTEGNGKSTTRGTSDAEREGEAGHDSVAENEQNGEVIARGQTPTDDQIDNVWDEIQSQLYGRERVSLAPQVYQFQPNPQMGGNSTRVGERGFVTLPYKHPQTQRHGNGETA